MNYVVSVNETMTPLFYRTTAQFAGISNFLFSVILFLLSGFSRLQQPDLSDTSFDYVVVGGGIAGCVLASRLSEDSNVSVLLMEAGGEGNVLSRTPSAWFTLPGTHMDWNYMSTPQSFAGKALRNRQLHLTAGKVLGGGSMLNLVMWVRGIWSDFAHWVFLGAEGWSYEENLPYYIKSEDVQVREFMDSPVRGVGGPIAVNEGSFQTNIGQYMIEAGAHLGYRTNYDYNGFYRLGFSRVQSDVSWYLREDSDRTYISPILSSRPNLQIIKNSQATKILFDSKKRAVAVEYYSNSKYQTVLVNKEVVVAAGAIGSPKLLMLSGVGPEEHLHKLNIPLVQDLPVGENLMDHVGTNGMIWQVDQSLAETFVRGFVPGNRSSSSSFGTGVAALVDWTGFINTRKGPDDPDDAPDIQFISLSGLSLLSDMGMHMKELFNIRDDAWEQTFAKEYAKAYTSLQVSTVLLHPESRGVVRLSSNSPFDPPLVNPNYFQHPNDMKTMVRGMKFLIRMFDSPSMQHLHPQLITISPPDCPHTPYAYSDDYLECIARAFTQTIYHYSGTCRMGSPTDPKAVVDPQLRVIGVKGLRVVDTSVFPYLPAGNTQATAYMVAEKAADIITDNELLSPIRL